MPSRPSYGSASTSVAESGASAYWITWSSSKRSRTRGVSRPSLLMLGTIFENSIWRKMIISGLVAAYCLARLDVDADAFPHLLEQEALVHQVGGLEEELLAVGQLGRSSAAG